MPVVLHVVRIVDLDARIARIIRIDGGGSNGQLANRIDNVVVSGDKPFARFDNNSVIDRTTDIGNRTCCPNARLSTDETVSAHCHIGKLQCRSVVNLGGASRRERNFARQDLERADSLLINEVIRLFSRATPIDSICIIGNSGIGTTSGNNKGGGLIIDQTRKLSAFCSNQRSAIIELRIIGRNNRNRGFFYNQSRLASFNHFELICNVGARRFLNNAHPRIVYGALIRPHVGALCKRLYAKNRITTHVKSGNSKPSMALFRSTVGFLHFIAEKLDGDDALPLRDKRNVAIRHSHAGNTGRINISRIFIFPSRKDIPISRGIRNEGDAGVYLLNGRFVLGSTIRKSATVGLIRQYLRVGDITRIERG